MHNEKTALEETTLLSPLGLSPGLLYSALATVKPHHLVVLTSKKAADPLNQIIKKAKYNGTTEVIYVEDPFTCFQQADAKVGELLDVLKSTPCVINLTGGTTALQFIVQQTGTALENRGAEMRYAALIDRRNVQEQKENPWVIGELIWVT